MSLQVSKHINVDFYDRKYILVNAKQYDKESRSFTVACYNQGERFPIDKDDYVAYVRYKKPDGLAVLNPCSIDNDGNIVVDLTSQMLLVCGIACGDLIIVKNGGIDIDENGNIILVGNSQILSTMVFYVDINEASLDNSQITSSDEFDALNQLLLKAGADYREFVSLAKSYAVGETGVREGEDTDNAKYYCEQASASAAAAKQSEENAGISEGNAQDSANSASGSANAASNSASSAYVCLQSSLQNADTAAKAANAALSSRNNASDSAVEAAKSAKEVEEYYNSIKATVDKLSGAFVTMGTYTFEELKQLENVETGYLYIISNSFVTDETFRLGAGIEYPANTYVYKTADGKWDCFTGNATASVSGVKGDKENGFRTGNVNITVDNIGAIPVEDVALINEVKQYLGLFYEEEPEVLSEEDI